MYAPIPALGALPWAPERGHVSTDTWTADFMLRQNESRAFLGKYLNDPCVPWRHKRRGMMAIAGIIPVAKWLAKIKQRLDVSCRLCKRAREQRGASTGNLPEETYGHIKKKKCCLLESKWKIKYDLLHINSAFCD